MCLGIHSTGCEVQRSACQYAPWRQLRSAFTGTVTVSTKVQSWKKEYQRKNSSSGITPLTESTIVHHRKGESVRSGSFNLTCFGTCARIAPLSCFQVGYLPAQPRSAWPARIPGRCSKESIVQLNLKPPRVRQQHRALGVLPTLPGVSLSKRLSSIR